MKLYEVAQGEFMTDPDDIRKWFYTHVSGAGTLHFNKDGTVSVLDPDGDGEVYVLYTAKSYSQTHLPIKFKLIEGSMAIQAVPYRSLKGCPETITENFFMDVSSIESFKYAPKYIGNALDFVNAKNKNDLSLHDIHKHFNHVKMVTLCAGITSSVLGLLLLDGITRINKPVDIDENLNKVIDILNKHLQMPNTRPVLAQKELIQAGLKEFARY